MQFRDIEDKNQEIICNLKARAEQNRLIITWLWPIRNLSIMVFIVPNTEEFSEEKAILAEYRSSVIRQNRNDFTVNLSDENKYYFYAYDENNEILIRQKNNIVEAPVFVKFCIYYENAPEKITGRIKRIFSSKKQVTGSKIVLQSSGNLDSEDVLYSFSGDDINFCLPCKLEKGVRKEFDLHKEITVKSNKDNVKLIKVPEL